MAMPPLWGQLILILIIQYWTIGHISPWVFMSNRPESLLEELKIRFDSL